MALSRPGIGVLLGCVLAGAAIVWTVFRPAPQSSEILAASQSQASYSADLLEEGVHFRTVQLQEQAASDQIPITEYFWYGCPHCQAFEPRIHQWLDNSSDDISFEQVPVVWNDLTQLHAAVFYMAQELDDGKILHKQLFDRIIELRSERNPSAQQQELAALFVEHGKTPEFYAESLASNEIKELVQKAEQRMRGSEISSTPSVVVNHQWVVLNTEEVGKIGVFNVIDALVERARQQR